MKRPKAIDDKDTVNKLSLRVMRLMDDNHDLHQHISQLNNQILVLSTSFGTQVNALGRLMQECQNKQAELEKVLIERIDLTQLETKIN